MKTISSRSNQYIKDLSKLDSKKDIVEQGLFLVEGRNLISEAIEIGIVLDLLITDEDMYIDSEVNKTLVTQDIIQKLSSNKSNKGAIAVCRYEPLSVNLGLVNKIVVLENVNNPGNLGTIIRTSLAFGYDAVITTGESVFVYNDKVIRSAQGALFKMPVMQIKDFEALKSFKAYKLLLSDNAIDLDNVNIEEEKYAIVFGNEANGISQELQDNWEGQDVKINIDSNVESLNLAVAAGIALNKLK